MFHEQTSDCVTVSNLPHCKWAEPTGRSMLRPECLGLPFGIRPSFASLTTPYKLDRSLRRLGRIRDYEIPSSAFSSEDCMRLRSASLGFVPCWDSFFVSQFREQKEQPEQQRDQCGRRVRENILQPQVRALLFSPIP